MNAPRGHSNIQGLTDIGLMSNLIPGYLNIPIEKEPDYASYIAKRQFKPLRLGRLSYRQNYNKFFVSFQKAMWGEHATQENDWAYDYLPKIDMPTYDVLRGFELANQGKMTGYVIQGFNPPLSFPNRGKMTEAFSKMKSVVIMDLLQTETARFWENHDEYNDVDTSKIQTEVFELPTTLFAEEEGSLSNSSREQQWHWQAQEPPGECRSDIEIMAEIHLRMKAMYEREGGGFPDPIVNLKWDSAIEESPTAIELNGYTLAPIGARHVHPLPVLAHGLFGGAQATRAIHPWFGVALMASFALLFLYFWRLNLPNRDDVEWSKRIGDVVTNREDRLPELGKYNADQKGVFRGQTALITIMFVTGLVIWDQYFYPLTTIETKRSAAFAHSLAAVIAIAIIVVHIYAGIWVRGTGRAMVRGTVTGGWAYRHHRKWFRQIVGERPVKTGPIDKRGH